MDSENPGQVSPVADPGLADRARRRLARQPGNPANGAAAAAGCGGLVMGTAGLTAAVVLHFVAGLTWWWVGGVVAAAAALIAAGSAGASSGAPDDPDRDRIVDPSDLDDPCREILLRAQRAIAAVLGSEVYASDMLDHAAGEMVLRWHEWDIAAALREITRLRAELAASAAAGGAGPLAAAVLDSQQRALTLARDATEARAGALESYAVQVQAADATQQDWLGALRLSGRNSQYLDLVARTAAGEHALAEITGLTEQAVTAAEVFRGSLDQAALAAEALALPPAPATSQE
jgi:hypothetical protein